MLGAQIVMCLIRNLLRSTGALQGHHAKARYSSSYAHQSFDTRRTVQVPLRLLQLCNVYGIVVNLSYTITIVTVQGPGNGARHFKRRGVRQFKIKRQLRHRKRRVLAIYKEKIITSMLISSRSCVIIHILHSGSMEAQFLPHICTSCYNSVVIIFNGFRLVFWRFCIIYEKCKQDQHNLF